MSPAKDEKDVPIDRPLRIRFDRHVLPSTAIRQSIRVTGGSIDPDGGAPIAGTAFFEPSYDALERVITFKLGGGQKWIPGVRYTVTLWKPSERPDGLGFRAWDGGELESTVEYSFVTATDNRVDPAPGPAPYSAYCGTCVDNVTILGARDVLQRSCGYGTCHASNGPNSAAVGLDLSGMTATTRTAIGHVAHETVTGPSSTEAYVNPPIFGTSMPLIDPGNPGNSYVIWKMVLNDLTYNNLSCDTSNTPATTCEPVPGVAKPHAADLENMREHYLMGAPMPLGFALPWSDIRTLQAWIAAGAPTQEDASCPDLNKCKPPETDAGVDGTVDGGLDGHVDGSVEDGGDQAD